MTDYFMQNHVFNGAHEINDTNNRIRSFSIGVNGNMQTIPRNEDARRYSSSRRTSRIASTTQTALSSLQHDSPGEDVRRSSPSKQTKTLSVTTRSHHSAGGGIPHPSISSPIKASSLHDIIPTRKGTMGRRACSSANNTDSSRNSARRSVASEDTEFKELDRKKSNRPGSVSPFLKNTHRELKEQINKLQGHIKFIQELASMNDAKRIDLLFQMIDRDGGGTVDAEELAAAMRRNDELSFSDSIEKAIDMVAMFDKDGNLHMDIDEFRNYVAAMVKELDVSVPDFTEFLIVQLLLSEETPEEKQAGDLARVKINEEVRKRQETLTALASDFLSEAFEMLDVDNVGVVKFQEVAKALHQTTKHESKVAQKSLSVLLMIDANDTRVLNYEQFGRLILSVSKATRKSYDETADDLMCTLESQSTWDDTSLFNATFEAKTDFIDTVDDLTNRRLKQLFNLWDADGDGDISREELAEGLDKFQRASGINVDANAMAQALVVGFTDGAGGNSQLNPKEFAQAMILYAEQFGVEIHTLIDFMCSTSGTGNSDKSKNGTKKGSVKSTTQNDWADNAAFGEVDFWDDF
jgi:Ca2+-binding EF-hand superfamily protein